jgi:predicted RND superfamily exporter protein
MEVKMKKIPTKRIIILIACLFLCILLLITLGNGKVDNLNTAADNTKINKVKSYRAKVSIYTDSFNENYVVLNKENKEYNISFNDNNASYVAKIKDNKTEVTDVLGKTVNLKLKYDYTNTDLFLKGINIDDKNTVKTEEMIDDKEYTKYSFKVKTTTLNEILI